MPVLVSSWSGHARDVSVMVGHPMPGATLVVEAHEDYASDGPDDESHDAHQEHEQHGPITVLPDVRVAEWIVASADAFFEASGPFLSGP